jgi:Flp pilus assembly protein TadG
VIPRRFRSCADDERGAVAVVVAIFMVVAIGFAAFAVDLGSLWSTRRNMVTVSDAAALAGATQGALLTEGQIANDPCLTATSYATTNLAQVKFKSCTTTVNSATSGTITWSGAKNTDLVFARVWGKNNQDVGSTTTAEWGIPTGVVGLRPYALCSQTPLIQPFLLNPKVQYGPVKIFYGKTNVSDCGDNVPGNWGVLDFDGGSNPCGDIANWVANGYQGLVSAPSYIPGDTGSFSNCANNQNLVGLTFQLPLFDSYGAQGNGSSFHIIGFVTVKLISFKDNGPNANRYLELLFLPGIATGECCSQGQDTGTRVVEICAVDFKNGC